MTLWARLAPGAFVLIWSTGFIGARYGLPYAAPLTLLGVRMSIATAVFALLVLALRAPRLNGRRQYSRSAIVGILLHAVYLGGLFVAIDLGLPVSVTALIVCLQPILVAILAGPVLGEQVHARQWLGFALGFVGAAIVLAPGLTSGETSIAAASAAIIGLLGTTAAMLLQKKWGDDIPPVAGTTVQYAAAAIVLLAVASLTEPLTVDWTPTFVVVLAYMVLVLSVGAILLMFWLIRRGTASGFTSLYFLVPPATLVEAAILFGERLPVLALIGFVIATVGVALVRAPRQVAEAS
ncbi:MAG: DMT family transporter [Candidatus Nanopelagicales bacterium]